MIGYIMLGTNRLETAIEFYDSLLAGIGANRAFKTESMAAWRFGEGTTMLSVTEPFDREPASVGNGTMVAINVERATDVDRLHAKALALGATDEGSPGPRGKAFYAGYIRDPDGNKLNFYCDL